MGCVRAGVVVPLREQEIELRDQFRDRKGQLVRRAAVITDDDHREQTEERDEAARKRIDEELACRVAPLGPPPDADQEEERHQCQLEKDIKENDVECQEDAGHAEAQRQQPGMELVNALLDRVP